jgi:hypothetical protein
MIDTEGTEGIDKIVWKAFKLSKLGKLGTLYFSAKIWKNNDHNHSKIYYEAEKYNISNIHLNGCSNVNSEIKSLLQKLSYDFKLFIIRCILFTIHDSSNHLGYHSWYHSWYNLQKKEILQFYNKNIITV